MTSILWCVVLSRRKEFYTSVDFSSGGGFRCHETYETLMRNNKLLDICCKRNRYTHISYGGKNLYSYRQNKNRSNTISTEFKQQVIKSYQKEYASLTKIRRFNQKGPQLPFHIPNMNLLT